MNFLTKKTFTKKGFTLIEMLIVIVIIGILASALIPRLGSARGKANDVAKKADLQQIATAIISYQIDTTSFPTGKNQILPTIGTMYDAIIKGGAVSVPTTDTSNVYSGLDLLAASGYVYYPMKKNGNNNNGFILMAKTETEGGSNYIVCLTGVSNTQDIGTTYGSFSIDSVILCNTVTLSAGSCSQATCTYSDKAELRYLYKY